MKKIVIVTGGAGFIGTNLANKLINDGYEVIIIDDLSSGYRESINNNAPSQAAILLDTSYVKSTWPGVSIKFKI